MYIEEKIIATILLVLFSIAICFVARKGNRLPTWKSHPIFGNPGPLIKEDGTLRKWTKLGFVVFFCFWIIVVWVIV
jgi:hypothetical protein